MATKKKTTDEAVTEAVEAEAPVEAAPVPEPAPAPAPNYDVFIMRGDHPGRIDAMPTHWLRRILGSTCSVTWESLTEGQKAEVQRVLGIK